MSTYYSLVKYTAPGDQDIFTVPFGYIDKSHVSVKVNGIDVIFTWLTDSTVQLSIVPGAGSIVQIKRDTPRDDRLVNYQDGSTLSQRDLNQMTKQNFYLAQEAYDLYYAALYPAIVTIAENGNVVLAEDETVIDQLAQEVLNSSLFADLNSQIGNLDSLAEAAMQNSLRDDVSINFEREIRVDVDDNSAAIVEEATVRASETAALAATQTTLQTTVDGHTATIAVQTASINGLEAQFTVKVDVNGYVSGFGLASYPNDEGVNKSSFVILADQFQVITPGKTAKVPFIVGNVGGASQVGINGNLMVDGTITADSIAANAITAGKINVTDLAAINANLGAITAGSITISGAGGNFALASNGGLTIKSGTTGQRLEVLSNRIDVYDSSNNLRVRIGEL